MEKQFVTYEIAKALKELGFNEKCFGYFNEDKIIVFSIIDPNKRKEIIFVPLWQQVIDWFLDKYQLCLYWKPDRPNIGDTEWVIEKQFDEGIIAHGIHMFPYDAREAAILEAIEIVKNNN
jgi:hypothetical protein